MASITTAQLTSGAVLGSGVFDILMQATKAHLQQEFEQNRIKGSDYANVYLGSMTAAMQNAVQFVLAQQTSDKQAELLVAQTATATAQLDTIAKQNLKLDSEIALLDQKKFTEDAQIQDTVNGASVLGVVGKQKALYGAQTDGFQRDAEQKLMKQMLDTWSVRQTTDGADTNTGNHLSDTNIGVVVAQAMAGIGVAPTL